MANRPAAPLLLRYVHKLVHGADAPCVADTELLRRFTAERSEPAFQALFRRHAGMVVAVARHVLGNAHDAEDVCQATFLLLAQKASSIRATASLAGWLHKTSHYLALKLLRSGSRRRRRENRAGRPATPNPLAEITGQELLAVLDEELLRLPEALRAPLVLCYLEGATRDGAAQQLGCDLPLIKRRLEHGRKRLHAALVRRGVGLSAVLLGAVTSVNAARGGAATLLARQVARTASALATGKSLAGSAPTQVIHLLEGELGMTCWINMKLSIAIVLLGGILSTTGVLAYGDLSVDTPRLSGEIDAAKPAPAPLVAAAVTGSEKKPVDEAQMEAWWTDLEKTEAEATRALLKFSAHPKHAVAYFKKKMKPLKIDAAHVRSLLAKLASDKEEVWKPAFNELEYFDPRLAIDLETLMKEVTDAPARQRMVEVLSGHKAGALTGKDVNIREVENGEGFNFFADNGSWWAEHRVERINTHGWVTRKSWIRAVRVIVLLEHIHTPAAVAILRDMASGHPDAQPTRAAREALAAVTKRP